MSNCESCPLQGRSRVLGSGPLPERARLVVVGEAPGLQEARERKPFVGKSGQLLRSAIRAAGINPDDVYYTNVVKCHPPGNRLPEAAVGCCKKSLSAELKPYSQASVKILTVGAVAGHVLVGHSGLSMLRMRGKWYRDAKVVCSRHPANVLREPVKLSDFLADVRKVARGPMDLLEPDWRVAEDIDAVVDYFNMLKSQYAGRTVCIDLETDQTCYWEHDVLCIGFAHEVDHAVVIPQEVVYHEAFSDVLADLFDSDVKFVGHNVKFDLRFLAGPLNVTNARAEFDTMLAHYLLDENTYHNLKGLASDYFDAPDYEAFHIKPYLRKKADFYSRVPAEHLMHYNALDVCYNLSLWYELKQQLIDRDMFDSPFMYPVMAAQDVLLWMELKGILVDEQALRVVSDEITAAADELHEEMEEACGTAFNPRSSQQTSAIVYGHYRAPKVKGRTYKIGSVSKPAVVDILQKIKPDSELAQWVKMYSKYRSLEKMRSTYVDGIIERLAPDGRAHTDFKLSGTRTGRLAAANPPLHAIPHQERVKEGEVDWGLKIRGGFIAPEGWVIMQADYSQAEMRVAAGMSGDERMIQLYQDGRDLHNETAIALYGENFTKGNRQLCKSYNFSQVYGGTERSFAAEAGMPIREAREFSHKWQAFFPQLSAWRDEQEQLMHRQGYVETPTGRRRRFPLITSQNSADARKASINSPIQGTASDLTLMALIDIYKLIVLYGYQDWIILLLTVHDSIIAQVKKGYEEKAAELMKSTMEATGTAWFPQIPWKSDVEVGPAWGRLSAMEVT